MCWRELWRLIGPQWAQSRCFVAAEMRLHARGKGLTRIADVKQHIDPYESSSRSGGDAAVCVANYKDQRGLPVYADALSLSLQTERRYPSVCEEQRYYR